MVDKLTNKIVTDKKTISKKGVIPAAVMAIIAATVALEGGYVNNPSDPGGETKYGVTKKVAVANGYTGPMKVLPLEVAHSIYYTKYMVEPGYMPLIDVAAPVAEELFDTTVNMGPTRPSTWFQLSINTLCNTKLVADGKVGNGTTTAYSDCSKYIGAAKLCVTMLNSLDTYQLNEYKRLVHVNPKLNKFYKGWTNNRINNVDRKECGK